MQRFTANVGAYNNYRLELDLDYGAQSIAGNYTTVYYTFRVVRQAGSTGTYGSTSGWFVDLAGYGRISWAINYDFRPAGASLVVASGNYNLAHNSDGTASMSANAYWPHISTGMQATIVSGSIGLPTIARASSFSNMTNPVDAGQPITFNIVRADAGFTHDIDWFFGTRTGRAATGLATTGSWAPPLDLLNEMPSTAQGNGFVRLYTNSGSTSIGYKDYPLAINAPASVVPTFTSVTHSEATTGVAAIIGAGVYVQGISKLNVANTGAAGVYGSTITAHKIEVAGQTINASSGVTTPILSSGTVAIKGTVTDSRSRSTTKTVNVTVLPYAAPTINAVTVQRALATGVVNEDGTYLRVNINAAVQSLINGTQKNTITYKVYSRPYGTTTWTLKNTTTPTGIAYNSYVLLSGYSIQTSYDVMVEVIDKFSTSAVQNTVPTAAIFMHWDGSAGVGIGKYRQNGQLDVLGQIYENNGYRVLDERNMGTVGMSKGTVGANYSGGLVPVTITEGVAPSGSYKWLGDSRIESGDTVLLKRVVDEWMVVGTIKTAQDYPNQLPLTMLAGWKPYSDYSWANPKVAKTADGIVAVTGLVLGGTTTAGTVIATLPPGFRPDYQTMFSVNNSDVARAVDVLPNGNIQLRGSISGYISLNNIVFPAAGTASWVNIESTLANSFVKHTDTAYGPIRAWKDTNGIVWLGGLLTRTGGVVPADNTAMCTLPAGYESDQFLVHMGTTATDGFAVVGVNQSRNVVIKTGTSSVVYISLGGLSYLSASSAALIGYKVLPAANGWVDYDPANYKQRGYAVTPQGLVHLAGFMSSGTMGAAAFKLPKGNRMNDEYTDGALFQTVSNTVRARVDIKGDGNVVAQQGNNGWYSFESIKFIREQ